MATAADQEIDNNGKQLAELDSVTIRFAGDSGDGMQLVGSQFSDTSALAGNDVATLPDFPAEIRAPAGSLTGVSGFQIHLSSHDIHTPGDSVQVLVAMNPAALKVNLPSVTPDGLLVVNEDAFTDTNLAKAKYDANPLLDGSLEGYRVYRVPVTRLTEQAVAELGLAGREAARCKNMFMLGLVYWLFDRPLNPTLDFIMGKFAKVPQIAEANACVLRAGYDFGERTELMPVHYRIPRAPLPAGTYRNINGNQAAALGLVAAATLANKRLFYASYPITPASEILQELSRLKNFDVLTFQAEDEIAAAGAAIGAAFGGSLAATGTSGPGLALKGEMIGLAVMAELPLVIINVQRGGPSTGLPTKTEQSDLLQAVFGRHGESPAVVLAAASAGDCFDIVVEACRIAVRYMVPVLALSDSYLANSSEPWRVPEPGQLAPIPIAHPQESAGFAPYARNDDLARPWAIPGTPGLMHRIGGLEKLDVTGEVSYDPANHERMVELRARKVAGVKLATEPFRWIGEESGELLLMGWGSSYGAIRAAVEAARAEGAAVSACHLRCLNPLPDELGERMKRFARVVAVEMNRGQLSRLLRDTFLVDVRPIGKVRGQPLSTPEVAEAIRSALQGEQP